MTFQAFTFSTQEEAQTAVHNINAKMGLPITGGVTQTYTIATQNPLDGTWYIPADDNIRQYLNGETTVVLPDPKIPLIS